MNNEAINFDTRVFPNPRPKKGPRVYFGGVIDDMYNDIDLDINEQYSLYKRLEAKPRKTRSYRTDVKNSLNPDLLLMALRIVPIFFLSLAVLSLVTIAIGIFGKNYIVLFPGGAALFVFSGLTLVSWYTQKTITISWRKKKPAN